jgi:CDP-4-dehydro-6-deoxyglucose reductase
MNYQVQVRPSGQEFTVEEGESILDAALRQGIAFPYGCRNGACGSCRGKVLDGEFVYPDGLPPALTAQEADQGLAIFCQARAVSDLRIEVDAISTVEGIRVRTLPARVARKVRLAHDVIALHLKLPEGQRLQFLAGQYIDILLKDGRRRAFSLANPPSADDYLELHVRHVPGGEFSHYVFHQMHEKALLRIRGPLGSFFLRESSERPLLFVAGGTGFAPVKGIIEYALARGIQRPIHLFWGVRARRDLYMHELATQWATEHEHVHYVPVLSEPESEDQWSGCTGWVHEAVLARFPDPTPYDVYASGPPVMVHAMRDSLLARGFDPSRMFSDAFEYAYVDGHNG